MLVGVNGGQWLVVVEMMVMVVIVEIRHNGCATSRRVIICCVGRHPGVWPDATVDRRGCRNRIDFIVGRTERRSGSVVKINNYIAWIAGGGVADRRCAASWHVGHGSAGL